ncbi:MAG: ACP phosphodiesterase [Desulfuromonadaceae bacterium]
MNYLFHLYLADGTAADLLGNLMGDFVKGRLDQSYPAAVRRGIERHRRIDSFAQSNAVARRSRRRLDPCFGHCRGILVDMFYDHFLAKNWSRHAELPLAVFSQRVYGLLEIHHQILPPGLQRIAPHMIAHNWLESYGDLETIGRVLQRIEARLSRPHQLGRGIGELRKHYRALEEDFGHFLAEATAYVTIRSGSQSFGSVSESPSAG